MTDVLVDEPLVLLALVLAVGGALGAVRVRGVALGPAGALVAGLVISGLHDELTIEPLVGTLGLALFTFAVGLASGPSLARSLRANVRLMTGIAAILVAAAALSAGLGALLDLDRGVVAGLYAGSLTNTPALAAASDTLPPAEAEQAVVGYALAYLYGVVGLLMAVMVAQVTARRLPTPEDEDRAGPLVNVTLRVGDDAGFDRVGDLHRRFAGEARASRILHDGKSHIATAESLIESGDLIAIACDSRVRSQLVDSLGDPVDLALTDDRSQLDFRRIVVSRSGLVGRSLRELDLERRHGAVITRVRRGDVDLVARGSLELEPGDRARVVGPRDALAAVARELGDSERSIGEFQGPGFLIGLLLGLAVGLIAVPVPGLGSVELGTAGGPLVVGLMLGHLHRTGPLVWQVPHGANLTLRQLGALLFLAVVGIRSGPVLVEALQTSVGPKVIGAGFVITTFTATALLVLGRTQGLGSDRLSGVLAGAQTQPAVLGFAVDRSDDPRVPLGYAIATPIAMVTKIVLAQVLVLVL